jgi:hypothetical protein
MAGYKEFCLIHGMRYSNGFCHKCIEQCQPTYCLPGDNETVSGWIRNLTNSAKVIQEPVSLGRWEEQTDHDREFLQACGISAL